ncbi:hypothetical protein GCM10027294_11930 [Marinactinospora endophytica]
MPIPDARGEPVASSAPFLLLHAPRPGADTANGHPVPGHHGAGPDTVGARRGHGESVDRCARPSGSGPVPGDDRYGGPVDVPGPPIAEPAAGTLSTPKALMAMTVTVESFPESLPARPFSVLPEEPR